MAIRSCIIVVGTSPTPLLTGDNRDQRDVALKNIGAVDIHIGDEDVTVSTGFPLSPGETLTLTGVRGDPQLCGVVATATANLAVMQGGV